MNAIQVEQIEWEERKSPKGMYHILQRNISLALGGTKDVGPCGGGHPFDLAQVRVPGGCKNWPLHRHSAQWELYYVLEGAGRYFDGETWQEIRPGSAVLARPGENHQIENQAASDLVYLVIADMPSADHTTYPATGRVFIKPERKLMGEIPDAYYDGHE